MVSGVIDSPSGEFLERSTTICEERKVGRPNHNHYREMTPRRCREQRKGFRTRVKTFVKEIIWEGSYSRGRQRTVLGLPISCESFCWNCPGIFVLPFYSRVTVPPLLCNLWRFYYWVFEISVHNGLNYVNCCESNVSITIVKVNFNSFNSEISSTRWP